MVRLLRFVYDIRVLLLFIFLEAWSFVLIKNNSPFFSVSFYTSSNLVISSILDTKTSIINYFDLVEENQKLREANALLKTKNLNSASSFIYGKLSFKNKYTVQKSRIINNSIGFSKNYLTIDVGTIEGVQAGMGVVGELGIIGMVKSVSSNYSTVTSLLHTSLNISVGVGKARTLASLNWSGSDYGVCNVIHLPKHVKVQKGDSIYTSGFGGIFPEEVYVGKISVVNTQKDKSFHEIEMELVNDFSILKSAYVVIDKRKEEKKSIEDEITDHE